jgi:hypothetical protein
MFTVAPQTAKQALETQVQTPLHNQMMIILNN